MTTVLNRPATLGQILFEEEFKGPLSLWSAANPKGRWKTNLQSGSPTGLSSHTLASNGNKQAWDNTALTMGPSGLTIAGFKTHSADLARLWNMPYTAGMISTEKSFNQLYGYFEAHVKFPTGKGAHPTFWLLPQDGSWPPELDIAEQIGGQSRNMYCTVHYGQSANPQAVDKCVTRLDVSTQFVTMGCLWTRDTLTWYQSDVEIFSCPNPGIHAPCHLLFTLEMGGKWEGPVDDSALPFDMCVQWVRVWALKS